MAAHDAPSTEGSVGPPFARLGLAVREGCEALDVTDLTISTAISLRGLTNEGRQELERCIKKYVEDVFEEAARLEEADRAAGAPPEITTTHVRDASIIARRSWRLPRKPSKWDASVAILGSATAAAAGTFGGMLHSNWQYGAFGGTAALAVTTLWYTARRPR